MIRKISNFRISTMRKISKEIEEAKKQYAEYLKTKEANEKEKIL